MLFVILNLLLIYIGTGYFSGIRNVSGERRVRQQSLDTANMSAESAIHISLDIKIPGVYPIPYINIEETLVRHNGEAIKLEGSVVPGFRNKGAWNYELLSLKRGEYKFRATKCTAYDVFGLLPHHGSFEEDTIVTVLPSTVPIANWNALMQGNRGMYSSVTSTKQIRESSEQSGIRDYIYGDRLSRVHWNATAKTGQWKSKDFEKEALPRTIVWLDRYQLAGKDKWDLKQNHFELAVSVTASLLYDGMKKVSSMGLLSCGSEVNYYSPKTGLKHQSEMMKHLTTVDCDGKKSISQILHHFPFEIHPNSCILLVTSAPEQELQKILHLLSKKGFSIIVFYITSDTNHSSALTRLRQAGYQIHSISSLKSLTFVSEGSDVG